MKARITKSGRSPVDSGLKTSKTPPASNDSSSSTWTMIGTTSTHWAPAK
jgi:hypothetical protein